MTTTTQITAGENANVSSSSVGPNLMSFLPIVLIFLVFYFLVIRPQEKKRKQHQELVSSVKNGEEVVLHSGMYGIVSRTNDDIAHIEIAQGVIIKVLKSAIADIVSRKSKS